MEIYVYYKSVGISFIVYTQNSEICIMEVMNVNEIPYDKAAHLLIM